MNKPSIAIVGAGPAGIACAIQLARMGLAPVIFESNRVGGLLANANLVENYPGFPGGISGENLAELFRKQAGQHGLHLIREQVAEVKWQEERYQIIAAAASYFADILVVASGTHPLIPSDMPPGLAGSGLVHFEVYPLLRATPGRICIIGAGDAAFDYALNLANRGNQVYVFNRGSKVKALQLLVERASRHSLIHYVENAVLTGGMKLSDQEMKLTFKLPDKTTDHIFNNVIFATGREPSVGFMDNHIIENQPKLMKDRRLYLIGDVVNGRQRQTAIATGDGIRAAMEIHIHASHPED